MLKNLDSKIFFFACKCNFIMQVLENCSIRSLIFFLASISQGLLWEGKHFCLYPTDIKFSWCSWASRRRYEHVIGELRIKWYWLLEILCMLRSSIPSGKSTLSLHMKHWQEFSGRPGDCLCSGILFFGFTNTLIWELQEAEVVVLLNGSDLCGSSCPFCLIFKVHLYVPSSGVHLWWSVLCNTSFVWVCSASTCPSILALYFCLITWSQNITS